MKDLKKLSDQALIDLEWFTEVLQNKHLMSELRNINLIITDIDASLTDGTVYLTSDTQEHELKGVSMQDNFGMEKALEKDLHIAFISGRKNKQFKAYVESMGISSDLYVEGVAGNKIKWVEKIQKILNLSKEYTLYFGDDMLDLEAKSAVQLFVSPSNAPFYIQFNSDLVIPKPGGSSAFRLLLDLILYVQKKHFAQEILEQLISEK